MHKQQVESLLYLKEENRNAQGYGLGNVNERIQLLYGKSYGLRIYSKVNAGTRIFIHIPIWEEHEHCDQEI